MKVNTFGGFSVSIDDKVVFHESGRQKKEIYLLMYILSNRRKGFTKNELIELLYKDSNIQDPGNALKILIHRLRKTLAEAGLPKGEYIIFHKGKYYWNKEVLVEIDTEVFEETF